jgi:hypothetical protein
VEVGIASGDALVILQGTGYLSAESDLLARPWNANVGVYESYQRGVVRCQDRGPAVSVAQSQFNATRGNATVGAYTAPSTPSTSPLMTIPALSRKASTIDPLKS